MELHCNVFELAAHMVISFLSSLSNSLEYNIKFFFYLFNFSSFFLFYKRLPSRQNKVEEPLLHGRWVEVIILFRVDGEREVSLPFSAEHCKARLIRAQPFSPTSLHRGKMDRLRENWPARNVIRERRQGDEGEVQASSY